MANRFLHDEWFYPLPPPLPPVRPLNISMPERFTVQDRWTERQRLEGEAADRAMIRLLKEESTWQWCDCE